MFEYVPLTHWGRLTQICNSELTIIGSDNGLVAWSAPSHYLNTWISLFRTLGTNFRKIIIEIHTFSFKKMHLRMSSAKLNDGNFPRPQCVKCIVFPTTILIFINMPISKHIQYHRNVSHTFLGIVFIIFLVSDNISSLALGKGSSSV